MHGMAHARSTYSAGSNTRRIATATLIVLLHVVALGALGQLEPVRSAITSSAPIVVSFVEPARPKVETPPKPLPQKRETRRPQPQRFAPAPILAEAPEAPAVAVPPAPPAPVPLEPAAVAAPAPVLAAASPPPPAPVAVTPPRFNADYLNNPAPAYPPLARRMGEEGKVVLRVHVNERGLPSDVQVRTSSGSPRLDGTALETVKQWKFVPARRGDTPVDAWVLVPISFSLRS